MTSNSQGKGPDGTRAEGADTGRSRTARTGGTGGGPSDIVEPATEAPLNERQERREARQSSTRLGMIWTATVVGLILLVLLIIFIAQNQDQVMLRYFGFEGQVALGLALFVASVAGGIVVAAAGAARIIQLRHRDRQHRPNAKVRRK